MLRRSPAASSSAAARRAVMTIFAPASAKRRTDAGAAAADDDYLVAQFPTVQPSSRPVVDVMEGVVREVLPAIGDNENFKEGVSFRIRRRSIACSASFAGVTHTVSTVTRPW
jgi:hypothetical protein